MDFLVNDRVKKGFCEDQSPKVTDEVMDTLCSEFCAGGVPFLVGSSLVGFNLNETDTLCDDPITADNVKVNQCRIWADQLDTINQAASDFVASMRILTYEQLKYKAAVSDQVELLEEIVTSKKTALKVKSTTREEDRIGTLRKELEANLADLLSDGKIQQPVTTQMNEVQTKANFLMEKLKKIDDLEKFVTECNELYLGTGANNEYLLNICPHSGNTCLNTENGRHVSCCCGVVPAAGMFQISAKNSGSRLLNVEKPVLDVCGQAYESSSDKVKEIKKDMKTFKQGPKVLNDYLRSETTEYSDFYGLCNRRLQEREDTRSSLENEIPRSSLEMRFARPDNRTQVLRNLQAQTFLTCDRPKKSTSPQLSGETLQVAFTDKTQTDVCKDIPGYSNDLLAKMCNEFCEGTHSATIPFLLGSLEMGFSHKSMDELCLQPAKQKYSKEFVSECQKKGSSFREVQAATAGFIGALKRLELAKIFYVGQLQEKTVVFAKEMKKSLIQVNKDQVRKTMVAPLKAEIKRNVKDVLLATAASEDVKTEITNVKNKGDELLKKLEKVMPELKTFLTTCNDVVTGVGSRGEYLLDMCPQQGKFCIDKDHSQHAGCCCGYNPIATLGMGPSVSTTATIQGNTANPAWEPTSTNRLLQEKITYNICGEASKETKDNVKTYETKIKGVTNGANLLAENQQKISQEYPAYKDRCAAMKPIPDPSGSTSTGGTDQANKCYRSFPSTIAFLTILITRWQ